MIKTESLLYKLDLRLNKLASNEHQQIPIENKILILREAIISLIKKKLNPDNNPIHIGLDGNKKRYHDLQSIIEKAEDHPLCLELIDKRINKYGAELVGLSPKMMFLIDGYVLGDKGNCKDRVISLNTEAAKHADLDILLRNSNFVPSFEYQETLSDITGNTLEVYSDGTFVLTEAFISYITYPNEIDYEGYCDFDGTPSSTVDLNLPEYLEDEILDIAQKSLALYTENDFAYKGADEKEKTNE